MVRIEVSTWEDMGGGKGTGGLDAVEEEDLVERGDEKDTVGRGGELV